MKEREHLPSDNIMPLNQEVFDAILANVSEGKSLRSQLIAFSVHPQTFFRYIDKDSKARDNYVRARECQAESSFEAILSAVNDVKEGKLDANAGRVVIDTYKWISARLKPTVYADKPLLGGGDNSPTELIVRWGKPRDKDIKTIDNSDTVDIPRIE